MHSVRLLTRFPALPSAFNGSAAPPRSSGRKAIGCFNDDIQRHHRRSGDVQRLKLCRPPLVSCAARY